MSEFETEENTEGGAEATASPEKAPEGTDAKQSMNREVIQNMELAAGDATLGAKVELAKVKIPVGAFEKLEEGQVLFFKKPDFARLIINDVPVYEVAVGTHGSQVGIRIENSIKPDDSNE